METVGHLELQRYLRSQRQVAETLISGRSLADVSEGFISAIAELLRWEAGALWSVEADSPVLRFVSGWSVADLDTEPLWAVSRKLEFAAGEGLPGRSWKSGEITWIPRYANDPGFVRAEMAEALELEAAFAIPIPIGPPEQVLAVAEFHTRTFAELSDELLAVLAGFADQLASFLARRRAEQQIESDQQFKTAVLTSALDSIVGMDDRGRVIEFNDAAERLLGHKRDDVIGRELADLIIPEELRQRHRDALQRYLETGEARVIDRRIELPAMRADGSTVGVELTVTEIKNSSPPVFVGFLRDVSDRAEAERARHHLAEVANSIQDAVLSKDLNGVVTSWNPGAERLYGYSAEEAIGRHISFLIPPDRANEEKMILDRVRRGERLETYETERIRADGHRVDVALTVSQIKTSGGLIGASVVARDITVEKRRRRAQEFLVAASRLLDSSLDPVQTARTIVATAVPELAELCLIDFRREDGRYGNSVVEAVDPEVAARLEAARHRSPLEPEGMHPVAQALRERRPMAWNDLADPAVLEQVAQDEDHRRLAGDAGYSSAVVVPLIARGRTLGALSFLHTRSDRRYEPDDLAFLGELGDRAAMALDNARLYFERDRIAKSLQRGLRPPSPPKIPGLSIAAYFEAAGEGIEIGGDLYDVLPTADGCWIVVGDVAGKGSDAAAVSVALRHSVRGLTREIEDPAEVLARVNELLVMGETLNDYATGVLLRMWTAQDERWRVSLASAGHPPAVHVAADGSCRELGGGSLLGASSRVVTERHELILEPGDTLALCTDGWLEVGSPEGHLGPGDFATAVATLTELEPAALVERLRADALKRGAGTLRDDMMLLVVRPENGR